MGIINVLDKHTANLIAAGEVVERPANAIKELIENSADAGAKAITVEIKAGGTKLVRVTDDGCGMSPEDAEKCVLRHATSKIKTKEDLWGISTMGFRGEALAAISAVSDMKIITKRKGDMSGTAFEVHNGEKGTLSEAGCPDGTTVVAENMFALVPARRKFLKSDRTETAYVCTVCEKFALSRPDISFTFIADGNVKFSTSGDGELKNAVFSVLGKEFALNMLCCEYEYSGVKVKGFVGKPQICRANRAMQNFFVNTRFVKSKTMLAALEEAFKTFCPVGKFPSCVLFAECDYSLVDVNVHPAKLEVKFADEKKIFETVYYAVRGALTQNVAGKINKSDQTLSSSDLNAPEKKTQEFSLGTKTPFADSITQSGFVLSSSHNISVSAENGKRDNLLRTPEAPFFTRQIKGDIPLQPESRTKESIPLASSPSEPIPQNAHKEPEAEKIVPTSFAEKAEAVVSEIKPKLMPFEQDKEIPSTGISPLQSGISQQGSFFPEEEKKKKEAVYIGEVFDSYIIAQCNDCMYVIDKHAAHERILYEKIKNSKKTDAQFLLEPVNINLTRAECAILESFKQSIENSGFDFEEFGDTNVLLRSYPSGLTESNAVDMFTLLIDSLMNVGTSAAAFDKALFTLACKAALKAGVKNDAYHNKWILDKVFSSDAVMYCPHGRPILKEFPKSTFDKQFCRT